MPAMSACLLGSINLSEYVEKPFTEDAYINLNQLKKDIKQCVFGLNECLHENVEFMPLKEQEEAVRKYKAIGLGYFGLGDMFIKLGMRYGSLKSINLVDSIGHTFARESIIASSELSEKYGVPDIVSENVEKIWDSPFYKTHFSLDEKYIPINTSLLTCAPTGSLSTMLGVSGGIEPIFSLKTWRKTESLNEGKESWYEMDAPVVQEWKRINNTEDLPNWIANSVAHKLKIEERVDMQATWQKHIDNAISSTVNLNNSTTVEEVMDLYMLAWEKGLKGITVYRDGCKRSAILNTTKQEDDETQSDLAATANGDISCGLIKEDLKWGDTIKCSDKLFGLKRKVMSGCGSLHVEAFYDWDGRLQEVFFNKGSDGGCNSFMVGLSRMTSLAARTGASLDKIVDQLASVPACASYVARTARKHDTSKGKNCPNAIGNALIQMQEEVNGLLKIEEDIVVRSLNKMDLIEEHDKATAVVKGKTEQDCLDEGICPLCYKHGEEVNLFAETGCFSCKKCGYSKCD